MCIRDSLWPAERRLPVADDIYEYFGGGGTREVEPIEEDSGEFEQGLGQNKKDEKADENGAADKASATAAPEPVSDDPFAAFSGNTPAPKKTEPAAEVKPAEVVAEKKPAKEERPAEKPAPEAAATADSEKPAKKGGGNWDFLANMLGLAGGKAAKGATEESAVVDSGSASKDESSTGQVETKTEVVAERGSKSDSKRGDRSRRSGRSDRSSKSDAKARSSEPAKSESSSAPAAKPEQKSDDSVPGDFFGFNFDENNPSKIVPSANITAPEAEPAAKAEAPATKDKADKGQFVAEAVATSRSSGADDGSGLSDDDDIFSDFAAPAAKEPAKSDSQPTAKKGSADQTKMDGRDVVDDEDFVEFEIEDLDTSEIDPAAEAARGRRGRGRRGRGRSSEGEGAGEARSERPSRSQRGRGGRGRSEEGSERSPRSEGGRSSGRDSNRDDSFKLDKPEGRKRSGGRGRNQRSDSDDSSESFDSQFVSEDIDPRDVDPRNGGVDGEQSSGGRKRRGRGGRGGRNRGGRGGRDRNDNRSDFAAKTADDRWNNPEPDDTWDNDSSSERDQGSREPAGDSEDRPKRSRRRRGGRGRGRNRDEGRQENQEVSSRHRDDEWDNKSEGGRDDSDRDDGPRDEGGRSGRGRGRRPRGEGRSRDERPARGEGNDRGGRGRGDRPERGERSERSGRGGRGRRPRGSEDDSIPAVPRYGEVPTWDDAISGVISSNIKSHGRSGGRSRGGRGRSGGGGNRNSGNNSGSNNRGRGDGRGRDNRDSGSGGGRNSGRNRR